MRFDVYANFPDATYGAENYPKPCVGCFSHQHIEKHKINFAWLIDTLFTDPDSLQLWGVKSLVLHGFPDYVELKPCYRNVTATKES